MAKFIILAPDGKTIVRCGRCSDGDLAQQEIPAGGSIVSLSDDATIPDGKMEWESATQTFKPHVPGIKRAQAIIIQDDASRYIRGGFTSSAKGVPLIYDSGPDEQTAFAISAIGGGMVMCKANAGGVFAPVTHTQAQARQVVADFVVFRDAALAKLATLGNQIRNANTPAEVQAVIWTPP